MFRLNATGNSSSVDCGASICSSDLANMVLDNSRLPSSTPLSPIEEDDIFAVGQAAPRVPGRDRGQLLTGLLRPLNTLDSKTAVLSSCRLISSSMLGTCGAVISSLHAHADSERYKACNHGI